MHRFIIIITIMLCGLGAKSAELWPFSEVNNRLVLSVNGGYHFDSGVAVMGFGATIKGFHITIGGVGSCKLPDGVEPSGKNESVFLFFHIIKMFLSLSHPAVLAVRQP